ncbi:mannose-1-phosphate guanylyltransferase/mannose-6-phosphate isomerase [Lebetimonas natsushimae]|uniref:mannose-1-phosphate guanylyltransferase n=1 Tax=Lebetimonas natsushimae TaxID=1936991 RepID=A0A292YBF9_9BACT|nr:mannose-1-phosphate guanylyltransferase/mannose-6-phosphate isomerase [Lebetimonas natsushimae]GAX86876.1 mannose-1-phosphate guanylyltransferase/mannose-6-phosphate isomerase [Lebetimonas natsushimae]
MKAVILAGGSGTRLFPLSRKKFPKQFLNLGDSESLFQKTVKRNLKALKDINDVIIITNNDYQFHVKNQLKDIFNNKLNLILEPVGRNTAPAIALAIKYAFEKLGVGENEILFVSPSDHLISPDDKFAEYIKEAEKLAKKGYIVTFGVNPTKPETGYGYIEAGDLAENAYKVKQFHEKPNLKTAQKYLMAGNYYWNSGMFAFSIETILEEFKKFVPEIYEKIENSSFEEVIKDFENMPDISIDYAVMEKTDKAVVLPLNIIWSDVGSWDSVYDVLDKDENQNVKIGNIIDIDTKNSLIMGEDRLIATIGVDSLMVIETSDAIVVAKKGQGQQIKNLVSLLKNNSQTKELTEFHKTVYRPWGSYTELEKGERYRIKKIVVNPGEQLSLQLHYHRSEHWIVVKGTAKVVLGDEKGNLKEFFIHENESTYVPKSTKHRLINPGKIPLELIEVQVGEYVEEDDIIRFNDKYKRV